MCRPSGAGEAGEGAEGVLVGTQKATVGTQASKQKRRSEETEIY